MGSGARGSHRQSGLPRGGGGGGARGCSCTPTPPARELAAGAGPPWPRLKSPARPLVGGCASRASRQEFPGQLEAAWDPAAAPELGGAAFPAPSLPPPPPASARLIILLIDKQSGLGGDSRRASVAKPWETRRAPPGNSAQALGPGLCRQQGPGAGL